MTITTEPCAKRIFNNTSFSGYPCTNKGKVEAEGKWYCGTHSPEAVAKRQAKSDAKVSAELAAMKANSAKHDRLSAAREGVVKALEDICDWMESQSTRNTRYYAARTAIKEYNKAIGGESALGDAALKEMRAKDAAGELREAGE